MIVLGLLAAALGFGGYQAWHWWSVGRFFVATDDAYVQADISVLAAKISGYLESVPVVNGAAVKKGDVIARLDDGDYRLALQAAQDKVATQESTIARIGRQVEAAQAQVAQAAAQLDATRADAIRAQADFVRSTQMQADYVAKSRIDQTRADRDRTEASVKGMEAGLLAARANVDVLQAQRREAESFAAELRTAVDRARRDLEFAVIRAPFDGVVGNKAVEAGAYVAPGTRIAALVPLQSVRIDANFKETQVERMRPGQPVSVRWTPIRIARSRAVEIVLAGLGLRLQPAPAGQRDRQLHQDRPAPAGPGPRPGGRRPRGAAAARPVGGGAGRHPHGRGRAVLDRGPPTERPVRTASR